MALSLGVNRRIALQKFGLLTLGACSPRLKQGEEWLQANQRSINNTEENASLLKAAEARIEKLRKAEVNLSLLHNNEQLSTDSFEVKLVQHHFQFGTIDSSLVPKESNAFFQENNLRVPRVFNAFTAKCYWNERWHQPIEKEQGYRIYSKFEEEVAYAKQHGMVVKGHPLVWVVPKALPDWVLALAPKDRLKALIVHVEDMVQRYQGMVDQWDVCNEFLWEPSLNNTDQRKWPHIESIPEILTYLKPALQAIRDIDPNVGLVLNDYGFERDYRPEVTAKRQRERYIELLTSLKAVGLSPSAMGTQCHVGEPYTMRELQTSLDELALAKLPIQVTEFWARANGEEKNATSEKLLAYVQSCYTLFFGHPAVNHITYWGGAFRRPDGQLGKKFEAIEELVAKRWHTHTALKQSKPGNYYFNGFFGKYELIKEGRVVAKFQHLPGQSAQVVKLV